MWPAIVPTSFQPWQSFQLHICPLTLLLSLFQPYRSSFGFLTEIFSCPLSDLYNVLFSLTELSNPLLPWNSFSPLRTWSKDYISQLSLQHAVHVTELHSLVYKRIIFYVLRSFLKIQAACTHYLPLFPSCVLLLRIYSDSWSFILNI